MHTTTKYYLMATLVLALMMQGCRERESSDRPHPPQPRDGLMLAELLESVYQGEAPLDNRYFIGIDSFFIPGGWPKPCVEPRSRDCRPGRGMNSEK